MKLSLPFYILNSLLKVYYRFFKEFFSNIFWELYNYNLCVFKIENEYCVSYISMNQFGDWRKTRQANPLINVLSCTPGISLFVRVYKPRRFRSILSRAISIYTVHSAAGGNLLLSLLRHLWFCNLDVCNMKYRCRENAKAHAAISTAYARADWNPYHVGLTAIR